MSLPIRISAEDFSRLFNVVELCSVNPDNLEEQNTSRNTWSISEYKGCWVSGNSAGGSCKHSQSYWKNPQLQLVLTQHDRAEEDETAEKQEDKQCTVFVELLQKNRRKKTQVDFLNIAFHIYKVPSELKGVSLSRSFFKTNSPVGSSGKYEAQRGLCREMQLDPGNYILLPSTSQPNQPGEFFVRIFSKTGNTLGTQDFTCTSSYLQVMATPLSLEDQERVKKIFDEEAGADDRLTPNKLKKLFNTAFKKEYRLPLDTFRQLIFGEATKGRCSLTREQTGTLLSTLRHLQCIFIQFDEDSSGTMSPFELSAALQAVGMRCDGKVLELLSERFASGEPHMPFHGFVSCVTRMQKLFALYESESSQEVKDRGINSWLLQFLLL